MRLIIANILFWISLTAYSQHFPVYSQYVLNGLVINPAYAGCREVLSASVMYRNQWVGFEGAPVTATLSAHMPLRNKAIALGLVLINEKIGFTNNVSCFGEYAYRIRIGKGKLSLGFKGGFEMLKDDQSQISTQNPDNVFNNNVGYFLPNFGFGAFYYSPKFFFGVSVPKFLSYREASKGKGFEPYNNPDNYNFLVTTGKVFRINDNFKIKPSTLLRYQINSSFQYDLNCNVILFKGDLLWVGISYRAKEAIVGLLEYQINPQMRIGYSYDYSLGPLSKYNSGSHEILFRYEFRYKINAVNPRYF